MRQVAQYFVSKRRKKQAVFLHFDCFLRSKSLTPCFALRYHEATTKLRQRMKRREHHSNQDSRLHQACRRHLRRRRQGQHHQRGQLCDPPAPGAEGGSFRRCAPDQAGHRKPHHRYHVCCVCALRVHSGRRPCSGRADHHHHFAPAFAETGTYSVLSFISWKAAGTPAGAARLSATS